MPTWIRLLAVAALTSIPIAVAVGQTTATVWDGVYSKKQADRGHRLYKQHCMRCHQNDLSGRGMAEELVGPTFRQQVDGLDLSELFTRIRDTMPADRPQTLTSAQAADILAYVLSKNAFPAGRHDLATSEDALAAIRFVAAKPVR